MNDRQLPQSAFVTGSARGIGAAIATHLAKEGISVAVHYRASAEDAKAVLAACQEYAPDSFLVNGDLCDEADAKRICDEVEERFSGLDCLVNNVGNYLRKTVLEMTFDEWKDQLESSLYTTFLTCRHLIPLMQGRGFGRVINIGYAGSQQAFYNHKTVPYHIAKTGVNMLTRNLAAQVAKQNVTVNCLGMGVIENSVRVPEDLPAGRVGEYADVLNGVDFLLSPNSGYVNGTQIDISGGWIPEQML